MRSTDISKRKDLKGVICALMGYLNVIRKKWGAID
jgi:hypothetical protein